MLRPARSVVARVAPALALLAAAGCAGGEVVSSEAVAKARRTWEQANIRDYDLEWTATGPMNGHYRVIVRNGHVRSVVSVLPDGRRVDMHPGRPDAYGVDGLFQIIDEELAQLGTPTPFGQPKGTTAVLRFSPDPALGYPRSYRRDVRGTPQGVAIDVIRLDRRPPEPEARPKVEPEPEPEPESERATPR